MSNVIEVLVPATGQTLRFDPSEHKDGELIYARLAAHGLKQKAVDKLARGKEEEPLTQEQKEAAVIEAFGSICSGEWSMRASGMSTGLKQFRQLVFDALKAGDKDLKIGNVGSTYEAVTEFGLGKGMAKATLGKARKVCEPLDAMDLDIELEA